MPWQFSGGRPETECGAGSMVVATISIRLWLPGLFARRNIKTLVDAPCGDFNWMAHTDLSGVHYVGIDDGLQHLKTARSKQSVPREFAPRTKTLLHLDILEDGLPPVDAILCRDFLQHLPNADALAAIKTIHRSGAAYLIATSHSNPANRDLAAPGQYRPLNLRAPPFNFPPPLEAVDDGPGRILGLWTLTNERPAVSPEIVTERPRT